LDGIGTRIVQPGDGADTGPWGWGRPAWAR